MRKSWTIQSGERLRSRVRLHHMRTLFLRRQIGEEGDPWTQQAIDAWAAKVGEGPIEIRDAADAMPATPKDPPPPPQGDPVGAVVAEKGDLKVVNVGKGWYAVRDADDKDVEKLRGLAAVAEWEARSEDPPKEEGDGE